MKKAGKRWLALLLCVVMCVSLLPIPALADGTITAAGQEGTIAMTEEESVEATPEAPEEEEPAEEETENDQPAEETAGSDRQEDKEGPAEAEIKKDKELTEEEKPIVTLSGMEDCPDIVLNEETTAVIGEEGELAWFRFVPQETSTYCFYSISEEDTFGYLFNSEKTELAINDEDGEGSNFRIEFELTAGETYYFGASYYSKDVTGSFPVVLTAIESIGITSILAENVTIREGTNGHIEKTDGQEWFCYDCKRPEYITVTTSDGERFSGEFEDVWESLYSNYGFGFDYSCAFAVEQSLENQFRAGETYEAVFRVGSKTATYQVTIEENPIASVEATGRSILEETNGYWRDTDENAWYYYECTAPGTITVTMSDGRVYSDEFWKVYYAIADDYGWYADYNYYFTAQQSYENQFEAGNSYEAEVSFGGRTATYQIAIMANPIVSIEATGRTALEETSGYWENTDGEEWFYYYCTVPARLTATMADGSVYSDDFWTVYNAIQDDYDLQLSYNYDFTDEQNYENQFEAGNSYEAEVTLCGKTAKYLITIVANPIVSVVASGATLYEGSNGYRQETDGNEWFCYDCPSPDSITVTMSDGNTYSGRCRNVYHEIRDNYGLEVNYNQYFTAQQNYEDQFTVGNSYEAKLNFGGKTVTYMVTIATNPIASVTATGRTILEESNGCWQGTDGDEWYYYYSVEPDWITVTMSDSKVYEGACWEVYDQIREAYGWEFNYYSNFTIQQNDESRFTAGNSYEAKLNFGGRTASYMVTIEENPIASVTAADSMTIFEETNGYWEKTDGKEWFYYYGAEPDTITVTMTDGSVYSDECWRVREAIAVDYGLDVDYYSYFTAEQSYRNPFTAGNTYEAELNFGGKTATYMVTIESNPIVSVSATDTGIYEGMNGDWRKTDGKEWFYYYGAEPGSITVTTADGRVHTGSPNSVRNELNNQYGVWFDYGHRFLAEQSYENQFKAGKSYEAEVTFGGKTATYMVRIETSPIASITATDAVAFKGLDGYYENTDGKEWFYFYGVIPKSITVKTTDGKTYSGEYGMVQQQLYSKYGKNFPVSLYYKIEQSYENQFVVGKTYDAVINYGGKSATYKITIKDNPIASVSVGNASIFEEGYGYYTSTGGETWYCYYAPIPGKVTIKLTDGTTYSGDFSTVQNQIVKKYGRGFNYNCYFTDEQSYTNQFETGKTYNAEFTYGGKKAAYKITIVSNPIDSVSVTGDVTLKANTNGQKAYSSILDKEIFVYNDIAPTIRVTTKDGSVFTGKLQTVVSQIKNKYGAEVNWGIQTQHYQELKIGSNRWLFYFGNPDEAISYNIMVQFKDVTDPGQFYYEYIYDMVAKGVIGGYEDGSFKPTGNCNRAAVVTFLWRLAGRPEPVQMATFKDMTGNSDFDKAISWAAEKGITTGYAGNLFKPWNTCNRAAIVTFLWRFAGSPAPEAMATFKDMTGNPDFDKAISWAAEKGITTGYAGNLFKPWNTCNRLAVASFLYRYDDLGPSVPEGGVLIGVAMPTADLMRWRQDGENMKNMLEADDYYVDLRYGSNDIVTQSNQIDKMIEEGCQALIVAPIDSEALNPVLEKAKEKNIPVIAYDRLLVNTDAVSYYVSFSNWLVGVTQGEFIRDALDLDNAEGPFNIEFITGDPGDNNINFFFDGAMSVLQPYLDSGKLVCPSGQTEKQTVATVGWSTENARIRFENIIANYYSDGTPLHAVLASNDSTALGVENALAASYTNDVYPVITGQDCDLAIMKNLINGKQAMSVFKDLRILEEKAVEMVEDLMQGFEPDVNDTFHNGAAEIPSYLCAPAVCTAENYRELLIDTGYYTEEMIDNWGN